MDDLFIVCVCVCVHICVCGCMELRVCVCMFSYLWKQPKNETLINKQSRLVQDTDMAARSHNQNNPHIREIARTPLSRVSRSLAWYPVLIEKLDRLISCGVFFSGVKVVPLARNIFILRVYVSLRLHFLLGVPSTVTFLFILLFRHCFAYLKLFCLLVLWLEFSLELFSIQYKPERRNLFKK